RYRRPFLRGSSYIGAIATSVLESREGSTSFAGGLDTLIDLSGSHFVTGSVALSRDSAGDNALHTRVSAGKRNRAGWSYDLAAAHIDAAYQPPLGFVRRRGVQQLDASIF